MNKKIINKIPLTKLQDAQSKLDEVVDLLGPYLVVLSPAERQAMVKMGAESFEFLEVSYGFAVENPELFPGFTEAAFFEKIFFITQELWALVAKLNQLRDTIHDTEMTAGNRALEAALAFYQTVKMAARHDIPGARVIFEELKPRRPSKRRSKKSLPIEGQRAV